MTSAPDIALEPAPKPAGFVVVLPEPPSDNRLKKPGRRYRKDGTPYNGMVPTKAYEDWKILAGHKLNRQPTKHVHGRVAISICIVDDGKVRADTTNVLKATVDLLVAHGLIVDDNRGVNRDTHIQVFPAMKGLPEPGEMKIRVRALQS